MLLRNMESGRIERPGHGIDAFGGSVEPEGSGRSSCAGEGFWLVPTTAAQHDPTKDF